MKKGSVLRIAIAVVVYLLLYIIGASSGMIHPACYAYAGTFLPLLMAFVYLYTAAHMQCFGAAAVLNGAALIVGLVTGEADLAFIIVIVVLTALAELLRKWKGYDTRSGVRLSFIPFAFSFYGYSAHWWTDTPGALAAAVEEMPAGYADKMEPVIRNIPVLIVMLVLTIPVAILAIRLAEKAMGKQAKSLQ